MRIRRVERNGRAPRASLSIQFSGESSSVNGQMLMLLWQSFQMREIHRVRILSSKSVELMY